MAAPDLELPMRFLRLDTLGQGAFGVVLLAEDRQTNSRVAVKLISRGQQVTSYTEKEAFTHRLLCHPHIIKFKEVFLTSQCLGIVLEYANLGDLHKLMEARGRLTEDQARWFFQQLMMAVEYMHNLGIAHRDIKLENILLAGSHLQPIVKLCDMGYAKDVAHHSIAKSAVGTLMYMAPEVLLSSMPTQPRYDAMVADVWSIGVVLFVMLYGQYPFEQLVDQQLTKERRAHLLLQRLIISGEEVDLPTHVPITQECRELLVSMLKRTPSERITVADIMKHPWFLCKLPPGSLEMNQRQYVANTVQTPEQVQEIMVQARELDAASMANLEYYADEEEDDDIADEVLPQQPGS